MSAYFHWFGRTHSTNLNNTFNRLPGDLFNEDLDLIDWGCGQGLATMLLCDFLNGAKARIKTVTLIEISSVALEKAVKYVTKFLPNAQVIAINKGFNKIDDKCFGFCSHKTRIHLFANIIDIKEINLESLVELLNLIRINNDYYTCVNPAYQGDVQHCGLECQHVCRLDRFAQILDGKLIESRCECPTPSGMQFRIIKTKQAGANE